MTGIIREQFSDPSLFAEKMAPVVSNLEIQPLHGSGFQIDLSLASTGGTALFSIDSSSVSVKRPATGDLWSLCIPIGGEFTAAVGPRAKHREFGGNVAHLLLPEADFDYQTRKGNSVLVADVISYDLAKKAAALVGARTVAPAEAVSTARGSGSVLAHFVQYFWEELQRPNGLWECPIALAEMEDCFLSLLALATSDTVDPVSRAHLAAVRRAEDYLLGHLTEPVERSKMADAAGVSMRTLSRRFLECHGVSPMAWLKERRLDAAKRDLQRALPGETTVTKVATSYGFGNLGRFARDYNLRFGETPSRTLRR
jgi:AraC-like DNA-binding protein